MRRQVEDARRRYLPDGDIDILFISEAPPADPSRFFYFDSVYRHDGLYLHLMRLLFAEARVLTVTQLRKQKVDYLLQFKERGYYLLDANDEPMPAGARPSNKRKRLQASLKRLVAQARGLAEPTTRVALISKSVYEVCDAPLKAAGLNVINEELIDFPAFGRQRHFARKLHRDLQASDPHLQRAIRSLEASLRYFGAGQAQQKERDRWVVDHFLKGLGMKFKHAEIEQPKNDPPDARFRGAEFEVKEIQEPGRRRGDEYRAQLKKARMAVSITDLLENFSPRDIAIEDVYRKIMEETDKLARGKYRVEAVRRGLDLLFYVNLGMEMAWSIHDGPRPDTSRLLKEGWRAVSFLHGTHTACVLFATESAPDFLREPVGRPIESRSSQ